MRKITIPVAQAAWATDINPKNSNFKNRKIRCRIIRFKSIFAIFSQKSNQTPAKDWRWLGTCTPFICQLVYTVSLLDTVEKWKQKQRNCVEWLIKGESVPSILDVVCLGNVISKYFSKLRVGTSKIQPELKCLENILLSFYESLFSGKASRTRVV